MNRKQDILQDKQDKLIQRLDKKLTKKDQKILREIINLEYKLTMAKEGHECELE